MRLSEDLIVYHEAGQSINNLRRFIRRAESLEDIIEELIISLRTTYTQSPEGRDFLDKMIMALNEGTND